MSSRTPTGSVLIRLLLACAALLLDVTAAEARVWTVRQDRTGDVPTLQAAIDTARAGDEILVEPGVYSWDNQGTGTAFGVIQFLRDKNGIWMHSSAGPQATIIDAQGRGRGVFVQGESAIAPVPLTFEGFTVQNGVAPAAPEAGYGSGGGLVGHLADTVVRNCIFRNNRAYAGGAIWWGGVSAIVIDDCVFDGNRADVGGGVLIVNSSSVATFRRCTFRDNVASIHGGGIYIVHNAFALFDCAFTGNSAVLYGGAIYAANAHPSPIVGCTVLANTASVGGGLYARTRVDFPNATELTIDRSVFAHNRQGLGVYRDSVSQVAFSCTNIYGNAQGDWVGDIADRANLDGNTSVDPLVCEATTGLPGVCAQSPCLPANNACGVQIGAWAQGCVDCFPVVQPQKAILGRALYNPYRPGFHSAAQFPYSVTAPGQVQLRVYDARGRPVRTLISAFRTAGEHVAVWDGRGEEGRLVPSGVYLLRLQVGDQEKTGKLTVIR